MAQRDPAAGAGAGKQTRRLTRTLSLFDCVAMVAGAVIGSAIFLVPSTVLAAQPSASAALIVFLVGGLISWFGALAFAELAATFPANGGEYLYLRESWGRAAAFLCGWSYLLVVQTGGIAALAVGFSDLLGSIVPMTVPAERAASVGLLFVLTAINYRGLRTGARTNNTLMLLKAAGLLAIMLALASGTERVPIDWSLPTDWSLAQFAMALVPVLWAYEGWNLVTFVSGEVKAPARSIPLALGLGLGFVMFVYAVSLMSYLLAMPVDDIVASRAVASEAAVRVLGVAGGSLVTVTMLIALAGAANTAILAAPRMYQAQSDDGLLPRAFSGLHPRFGTPVFGLGVQLLWASALSLTGSYEQLLACCTFVAWANYALCAAAILLLRRRRPHQPRPWRMPGYPWTTAAFVLIALGVVAGTVATRPLVSAFGAALVLSGLPLYFRLLSKQRAATAPEP